MPATRSKEEARRNHQILEVLRIASTADGHQHDLDGFEPYLEVYNLGIDKFLKNHSLEDPDDYEIVIKAISTIVGRWPGVEKAGVRDVLAKQYRQQLSSMPDPGEIYDDAMDLGLRLWLMVDCSWIQTTGTPWIWPEGMTIQTYVAAWFDPPPADPQDDKKRFPRKFTADNLERIAGIRVTWTDFLSEHLALNGNNEEISIFKHREWLQTLSDSRTSDSVSAQTVKMNGPATSDSCGLPTELLDETLRSIELLFPLTDEATNEFLKRQGMDISAFQVEPNSGGAPRRAPRLREFRYWREQLLDLIEEYESPPRHSRKIWRDRRNPMAFWTFWIGIVIFFSTLAFGLIAAVLAGVTIGDERNGRLSDARVNSSTIV